MPKAYRDSILDQLGADLDKAFEAAHKQHEKRREAAISATARAARWSGFARDQGYGDTLLWRSATLARADDAERSVTDVAAEVYATMKRLATRADTAQARIFGHVESATGGGEADLIDAEGCVIATSPIDGLGYYAIVAEASGEAARIQIRDAEGQIAVLDGRPLELTAGLMARRDFTTGRCGKVEPTPDEPSTRVSMPNLVGKGVEDAEATLKELGDFRISLEERHDAEAPAETVISQTPKAGQKLMPGDIVTLAVSLGPEPKQEMPDLVGLSEEEARKALIDLRYRAVQFTQIVDPKNVERVVRQVPDAGAPLGETMKIELCMGVAARLMPDLVERTRKEALEILVPDYVDAPMIREVPSNGPSAIVLEQDPKAGAAIGDAGVTLVISVRRKEEDSGKVEMPRVIGKAEKDALEILRHAGIEKVETIMKPDERPAGLVIAQRPEPGQKVEDGAVMPDVTGKTRAQALKLLKAEGFAEIEFDERAARGKSARVLDQQPTAGTRIKTKQTVRLNFKKPG